MIDYRLDADVAQSVEQLIRNQQVAGSSPAISSSMTKYPCFQGYFAVSLEV